MTGTDPRADIVFGPALIHGTYRCPDCGAAPDRLCHHDCPRYAEDPGDPMEPRYDDEGAPDGDS